MPVPAGQQPAADKESPAFSPQQIPEAAGESALLAFPTPEVALPADGDSTAHADVLRRLQSSQPDHAKRMVLQLQRRYGNAYVQRVLDQTHPPVQAAGQKPTPEPDKATEENTAASEDSRRGLTMPPTSPPSPPSDGSAAPAATATAAGSAVQRGFFGDLIEGGARWAFENAMRLAGVPVNVVMNLVERAGSAITEIFNNPGRFVNTLVTSVRRGFEQFVGNIARHLQAGLMGWLFGTLARAGIQLPRDFSLHSIFSLVMQILGLTLANIRQRLVRFIGEQNARRIEQAWNIISTFVENGLGGLWEMVREYIGNLRDMVMEQIREWLITRVIQAAVLRIVSMFNPVSGIINIIQMIYNVVRFLIERARQIVALFEAVATSVYELAMGNVQRAADAIENALARTLPVVISFLANLLGLSGIADRIREIIQRIQGTVNNAIDRGLQRIVGTVNALFNRARQGARNIRNAIVSWWRERADFRTQDGAQHRVFFRGEEQRAELFVASDDPKRVDRKLREILESGSDEEKTTASAAMQDYESLTQTQNELVTLQRTDTPAPDNEQQIRIKARLLREIMNRLVAKLARLNLASAEDAPTLVVFEAGRQGPNLVRALPLTKTPGNTRGGEPAEDILGWGLGRQLNYIRGHLLNHHLHGPGDQRNMVPIPRTINTLMSSEVEEPAKAAKEALRPGQALFYETTVSFHDGPLPGQENRPLADQVQYFPAVLHIEWGDAVQRSNRWEKGRVRQSRTYNIAKPELPDTAASSEINVNNVGVTSLAEIVGAGPASDILDERDGSRSSGPFANERAFLLRMQYFYEEKVNRREMRQSTMTNRLNQLEAAVNARRIVVRRV